MPLDDAQCASYQAALASGNWSRIKPIMETIAFSPPDGAVSANVAVKIASGDQRKGKDKFEAFSKVKFMQNDRIGFAKLGPEPGQRRTR